MTTPHRILGIDPGLNRTGYAVIERGGRGPVLRDGGVLSSTKGSSLAERIRELACGLREVLEEWRPAELAIEQVFSHSQFPKTAVLMAHARGALLLTAGDAGLPVIHYSPTQIKRLLTGSGRASKDQIQRAIQQEFRLERVLEPNDVADACAIALCHFHSAALRRLGRDAG